MNSDSRLIDWNEGRVKLGDEAMLRTLLEKFQQYALYDSISSIIKHAKAQEWDLVRRGAHSLRGSSGYMSAKTCQKLSTQLQIATQAENIDFKLVEKVLNQLTDHVKELQEYLSTEFGKPFLDPEKIFTFHLAIDDSVSSNTGFTVKSVPYQKVTESKPRESMSSDTNLEVDPRIEPENKSIQEPEQESNSIESKCNSEVPAMKTILHQAFNNNYIKESDISASKELNNHWRCSVI